MPTTTVQQPTVSKNTIPLNTGVNVNDSQALYGAGLPKPTTPTTEQAPTPEQPTTEQAPTKPEYIGTPPAEVTKRENELKSLEEQLAAAKAQNDVVEQGKIMERMKQ
jgi:hypothetical protein